MIGHRMASLASEAGENARKVLWLVAMTALAACSAEQGKAQVPPPMNQVAQAQFLAQGQREVAAEAVVVPDLGTRKQGEDWPVFLGPTGDSKSSETGIITDWPKTGLPIVWKKQVETSYAMPVISKGRLFLFVRSGDQAKLQCFKSETGEFLWDFTYPTDYEDYYGYNNGPRCCPIVDQDRVYIYGAEGKLHCLQVTSGKLLWSVDTFAKFGVVQNFFGVGSTPVIEGDLLIVQVGGSPPDSPSIASGQVKGNGSGVVAFDKLTGQVRYQLSDELASYSSPTLATIGDRRWCFVFARGGLLGFEPATGKLDFHYPWRSPKLESVNASNPVVVDNTVFISECYGPGSSLLKVRPGGFDVVWADDPKVRFKSMQTHWNTCIHHEGYLYGSSGRHSQNAELRCIELATGKVKWSVPGIARSSLLFVDGHLICQSEYGPLLLLKANPEKLELVAQSMIQDDQGNQLLEYPCWAAPILSHGLLYVRGEDQLVCMELIPEP